MDQNDAIELWSKLGAEGKAPTDLTQATRSLPTYTVGFEPWIDRLARRYLGVLCRKTAHFKLALAPYGGGKTHFLLALGVRARKEGFAVAYVPCSADLSLDKPLDIYRELVKHLQLPDQTRPGLRILLEAVARTKRADIQRHGAPDPEGAFQRWATTLRRSDYPENAFGRVMSVALAEGTGDGESPIAEAAFRWLQGDPETLTRDEMAELRLARVPASGASRFGRDLLLSLIKFLPEAGVHGLVLLIDEVETLFATSRGKALLRVLAAMRVLLDIPTGVPGGVPLFGVFSATPDVTEEFDRYPALAQRLAVHGASFSGGNDLAPQLPLEEVLDQEDLLTRIGVRLIDVGSAATGTTFNASLQERNARLLAQVASERSLDVNARRLFVKTWVGLLDLQASGVERELAPDELESRYVGASDLLRQAEEAEFEP